MDTREFNEIIAANSSWISALRTEVGKVVIGQQALVDRLILSLLCKGHVLLEGVPGLAKTLSVKAMAACTVCPHPVYAGSSSGGFAGHNDL